MARGKVPDMDPAVAEVMAGYSGPATRRLRAVRRLVHRVAAECGCGALEETTKWGQIAWLPKKRNVGSTIRVGATGDTWTLYVHCQTSLVSIFKSLHPQLHYEGKRAVVFRLDEPLDEAVLAVCIDQALTYHLRKKAGAA